MTELRNDCFIRALLRQPVERTPVWMMRQAGRYLPEYRRVRQQAGSFMNLCTNPELACEVTLQPLDRYRLDAAILFSDILTIPDAMGLGLEFVEGEGPQFRQPVRTAENIRRLSVPDPEERLRYVPDAVRLIRRELDGKVPLIGFSGSPWTLATYMVEGRSSREFRKIKALMYEQPLLLHQLLDTLAQSVSGYLQAQIDAGVDAIMVFDTWGGVLSPTQYRQYSLDYARQSLEGVRCQRDGRTIPATLFTKGGGQWLEAMSETGYDALGLDWTTEIGDARRRVGDRVALQGNLDPQALYAPPESLRSEVRHILESYGQGSGHVFNLGHGVWPDVNPEHVGVMIEAVHEFSPDFHRN
ncbi:MAG: uroporphyrinogen decarboxylase [Methylococcaceae bacterium]|jgi:uroporphyrinogen decarboxylase